MDRRVTARRQVAHGGQADRLAEFRLTLGRRSSYPGHEGLGRVARIHHRLLHPLHERLSGCVTVVAVLRGEDRVGLVYVGYLKSQGHDVVGIAESGERALALARAVKPDLTLMDVRFKGSMDGIQAAAVMAQELSSPVVFLTSFNDAETVRRAAETGSYGYLTKPFEFKELLARVHALLRRDKLHKSRLIQIADLEIDTTAPVVSAGAQPAITALEWNIGIDR